MKNIANRAFCSPVRPGKPVVGIVAASLMSGMIVLACGAIAADAEDVAVSVLNVKAADVAGRWSGSHYGYAVKRETCGDKPCALTIDVTACTSGWCGVLVKEDGSCGGAAMKIEAGEGKESWMHFNGHLELDPKAASYVIQATLWGAKEETRPTHLDLVGDTGKEMLFMRRSFPFQAHLARSGEPQCTTEKATS